WSTNIGQSEAQIQIDQGLRAFMIGVYNHMTLGLGITGLVALAVHYYAVPHAGAAAAGIVNGMQLTDFGVMLYASPLRWVVMLAPLVFVVVLSFGIQRIAASTAQLLFLAFAAVMGLSISSILLVYTGESIARAFFITAASFGALSLYGYTTRRN